jgi:hypothetical protein
MVVLAFAQLMPELLASEYPLRFMNLPGSYCVIRISLLFDTIGVGHGAWALFFVSRRLCCKPLATEGEDEDVATKPPMIRFDSAELLVYNKQKKKQWNEILFTQLS